MEENNIEIIKNAKETITKARHIESMLKSKGWKYFLEIKENKKNEMISKMFKSSMSVKIHEYNRGAMNIIGEIEDELKGCVEEAITSADILENYEE